MRVDQPVSTRAIDAAPKPDEAQQIRQLAQEFEAMLLLKMLRQMRQSMLVLGEETEGTGFGGEIMTDTMDTELARHLASQRTLGLADVLARALESPSRPPSRATEPTGAPRPVGESRAVAPSAVMPTEAKPGDPEIALPFDSLLTSRFGWRIDPISRKTRFHGGVDVRAAYGREVPAPTGGRVVFAGEQGGYGLTVVLEHEPGVQSRYAHLSSLDVAAGQTVEAGQVLGRVGSSGRSTGPHLHVELSVNGKRVDPEAAAVRLAGRLDGPIEAY